MKIRESIFEQKRDVPKSAFKDDLKTEQKFIWLKPDFNPKDVKQLFPSTSAHFLAPLPSQQQLK